MEPWQLLFGAAAPLGALVAILVWLIRKYSPDKFVRREDYDAAEVRHQAEVKRLDDARKEAIDALRTSENGRTEERATTRSAVEGNRAIEYVFTQLLPASREGTP